VLLTEQTLFGIWFGKIWVTKSPDAKGSDDQEARQKELT
jgi:hypothetical protein